MPLNGCQGYLILPKGRREALRTRYNNSALEAERSKEALMAVVYLKQEKGVVMKTYVNGARNIKDDLGSNLESQTAPFYNEGNSC